MREACREWILGITDLGGILGRLGQPATSGAELLIRVCLIEAALSLVSRTEQPKLWAKLQIDLGTSCKNLPGDDRADNIERAIEAFESALTVLTRQSDPEDWAGCQNNLGNSYLDRLHGDRSDNLERAIRALDLSLSACSREASGWQWASCLNNRGNAYAERILGDRAENQERAIADFNAALTVITREKAPTVWAGIHVNLGATYAARVREDRAKNIAQAVQAYEAALPMIDEAHDFERARKIQHELCKLHAEEQFSVRHATADPAAGADPTPVPESISEAAMILERAAWRTRGRTGVQPSVRVSTEPV